MPRSPDRSRFPISRFPISRSPIGRPGPWVLVAVGWALVAGALAHAADAPESLFGRVVGVTDGDTLTLLVDGQPRKVRLAQIDAPESGQPWGGKAKTALSELAFGRDARVEVVDVDRYGRLVGEVYVGDVHVNQELVRRGHAWAYTEYSPSVAIIELEDAARAAGRGLWALPDTQRDAPWQWRHPRSPAPAHEAAPRARECGAKRSCGEMASCAEARFHHEQCGLGRLDGDGDGVPCEALCAR